MREGKAAPDAWRVCSAKVLAEVEARTHLKVAGLLELLLEALPIEELVA